MTVRRRLLKTGTGVPKQTSMVTMHALLTIWLPVAATVAAALVLHRRRPQSSARALQALARVVEGEQPATPHLRLVVDNTRRVDRAA
jgi:hypothetical protein